MSLVWVGVFNMTVFHLQLSSFESKGHLHHEAAWNQLTVCVSIPSGFRRFLMSVSKGD